MKLKAWIASNTWKCVLGICSLTVTMLLATSAMAWQGWGDEGGTLNTTSVCQGASAGNYLVFLGYHQHACDLIGTFAHVSCDGQGNGVVTGYSTVVLPQQDCPHG